MQHIYYIFRHGKTESNPDDRLRQLSKLGKKETQDIYQSLLGIPFDLKIVSSALRTQQTAEILAPDRTIPKVKLESLYLPKDPKIKKK